MIIKNKTNEYIKYIILLFVITIFHGCLIVKEKDEVISKKNDAVNSYKAPKPEIKMSNKIVRTITGDMMALLPDGWFFIETGGNISTDVFAVAVNPEYTMSAIFSKLKKDDNNNEIVKKEGFIGLARIAFTRHEARSGGLKLINKYEIIEMGAQKFGSFSFVKVKNNHFGTSAVFISSLNEYYEFSLVTLDSRSNIQPTKNDFDKTYRSILATLKY